AAGAEVIANLIEAFVLAVFLSESFYDAHAGEHAGKHACLLAAGIPIAVVLWVDAFPKEPTANDDKRRRNERVNCEFWIERHEHYADGRDLDDLQQEAASDLVKQALDDFAVVSDAAGDCTNLVAIVVLEAECVQFVDEFCA